MSKWIWILGALAILDVVAYTRASEAAQHDIRLIAVMSLFLLSAVLPLRGAVWLMDKSAPDHAPLAATVGAMALGLVAVAWACFVFYAVLAALVRSVT